MELIWHGYTRVYFNAYDEPPNFWSLDQGPRTDEVKASEIMLDGCLMATEVHPDSNIQPRAFFFGDCRVYRTEKGITVCAFNQF
jgi:hypothetical protein